MNYGILKRQLKKVGAVALGLSMASPGWAEEIARPNIVLIYADDVGWGDLGVYGAELIPTPNLDRLAAEGIRFTDAYATAATCTPSRYSLLTGDYAFRNPRATILRGDSPALIKPGTPNLASILQEAGYRTSVVGKWHLGLGDVEEGLDWNQAIKPGPLEIGFDESFLLPATNDRVPTVYVKGHYVYNLSEDDDPIRVSYREKIGDLPTGRTHPELLRYLADGQHSGTIIGDISRIGFMDGGQSAWWDDETMAYEFAERSVKFIEANQERPFFLFLSMHENHVPRAPHPDFVGKSQTGLRGDTVVELDWVVGDIMNALERLDLRDDTLIIFTSDNGPIFFDGYYDGSLEDANGHRPSGPFRGGKYQPFEGGTRMPTIASWPNGIEAGIVSDAIISQVDFPATLGALAHSPMSGGAGADGQNLLPALLGKSPEGREHVVQQAVANTLAIRKGSWKLIPAGEARAWSPHKHNMEGSTTASDRLEPGPHLFNLDDDPGETTNVAADHPEIVAELTALLQEIRETPQR